MAINFKEADAIQFLCDEFRKYNRIDMSDVEKYGVRRGLRNPDGTGVMAGLTLICDVVGYEFVDGVKTAVDGELYYRGINVKDIIAGCAAENRFGFEEVSWLLLFGNLPTAEQLAAFREIIAYYRDLPPGFAEDMIMKAPSPNIMNKLERSILALYSYDDNPEDRSLENLMRQAMEIIARTPTIVVNAYQVKRWTYDHRSMYFHTTKPEHSIAESVLRTMRGDKKFSPDEARVLDLCFVLQAEHGGGNNSTFATRVLSSAATDTYSALGAGVGSLKGDLHGGANIKVNEMFEYIKAGVGNWQSDDEVLSFLEKIMRKEAGDRTGLIYGVGHAVYTKSDPRAQILKAGAIDLARKNGAEAELDLLMRIEKLAPVAFHNVKGGKDICANVDLYSGFVYRMLRMPPEVFTPLFAIARMPGWCAHRIEEVTTGGRIIRPAYKFLGEMKSYTPLSER